jgi:hypothetical protein
MTSSADASLPGPWRGQSGRARRVVRNVLLTCAVTLDLEDEASRDTLLAAAREPWLLEIAHYPVPGRAVAAQVAPLLVRDAESELHRAVAAFQDWRPGSARRVVAAARSYARAWSAVRTAGDQRSPIMAVE